MNAKQKKFADYYIELGNVEQAALKAGYSKTYARSQSYKLLANVGVKEYIEGRMEELQDEKILTQQEILVLLSEIGRGEAKEYKEVVTKKGEYIDNPNSDDGKKVLVYNEYADVIGLPTKNSDRNKALELLGKRYMMWTDKHQVEDVTPTFVEDVPDED